MGLVVIHIKNRHASSPMPFGSFVSVTVLEVELDAGLGESPTIVDVDEERLKVFAKGAR